MPTVVLFGSNVGAVPLIQRLRKCGFRVLVLGHDPTQMGARWADAFRKIDYRDVQSTVAALRGVEDIAGYVPGAHDLCHLAFSNYMDYVSEAQGLNGQRFEAFHNKKLFRPLLMRVAPDRCPPFITVENFRHTGCRDSFFPALYKPEHAGGGHGIEFLPNLSEAIRRFDDDNASGIIESFVPGVDYSVSLGLRAGALEFFYADREVSEGVRYRISGSVTSAALMQEFQTLGIPAELGRIAVDMGVNEGFVHCQVRMNGERNWYLVESTLRMPGDCYPYVPEFFGGFDYSGFYLQSYLPTLVEFRRSPARLWPEMQADRAVGRVCISPGMLLREHADSLLEIHSHTAGAPARYTVSLYAVELTQDLDLHCSDLRLTHLEENHV